MLISSSSFSGSGEVGLDVAGIDPLKPPTAPPPDDDDVEDEFSVAPGTAAGAGTLNTRTDE